MIPAAKFAALCDYVTGPIGTLSEIQLLDLLGKVAPLRGITGARFWTPAHGKERLYIQTDKRNGGHAWNGGVGYRVLYFDLVRRRLVIDRETEAGAATRRYLEPTIEALEDIADEWRLEKVAS